MKNLKKKSLHLSHLSVAQAGGHPSGATARDDFPGEIKKFRFKSEPKIRSQSFLCIFHIRITSREFLRV